MNIFKQALFIFSLSLCFQKVLAANIFDFLPQEKTKQEEINNEDIFTKILEMKDNKGQFQAFNQAKIVAINKIVANSQTLIVNINEPIFFHNLEVKLLKCFKNLDPYHEDSYGLFNLVEYKMNDDAKNIFQGWLISSSPSLSTLQNPIYEIFILDCF